MRTVFFGTSEYCLPVLESLKKNFDLVTVVTRPDKPVGRKQILTPSVTKVWAEKNHLPVITDLAMKQFSNLTMDLGLVADFGQIIPEEIFTQPKLGMFNIHFSKLPEFRGASPVQATLLRGDTTAWITIFKIEKTLDTGPILWQKSYPILPNDTAGSLYTRLFQEVATKLPCLIPQISQISLIPQDSSQATYTKLLTKQDGFVSWDELKNEKLKIENYNHFRAMTPWPGLWTLRQARGKLQRMKILKCHLASPGLVRLGRKENKLVLDEIQFEGKKPQRAKD